MKTQPKSHTAQAHLERGLGESGRPPELCENFICEGFFRGISADPVPWFFPLLPFLSVMKTLTVGDLAHWSYISTCLIGETWEIIIWAWEEMISLETGHPSPADFIFLPPHLRWLEKSPGPCQKHRISTLIHWGKCVCLCVFVVICACMKLDLPVCYKSACSLERNCPRRIKWCISLGLLSTVD